MTDDSQLPTVNTDKPVEGPPLNEAVRALFAVALDIPPDRIHGVMVFPGSTNIDVFASRRAGHASVLTFSLTGARRLP